MNKRPSNSIDLNDPASNMFGLLPCPKCGNAHRWLTRPEHPKHPNSIVCDDCEFVEPIGEEVES